MNKWLIFLLIPLLAFADEPTGAQLWNSTSFYLPISKNMTTRFEAQIRTEIKSQTLMHRHIEAELVRPILPFISLGAGYRQTEFLHTDEEKDHMPFVTLSAAASKNGWRLEYRARAEYLFLEKLRSQDIALYRNKLSVDFPLKMNRVTLHAFISDEIFLRAGEKISENRLKVGFRELMNKKLVGDIFYQLRTVKSDSGTWGHSSDIGLYTTILF